MPDQTILAGCDTTPLISLARESVSLAAGSSLEPDAAICP
jgi:hypothetical protein